MEALYGNGNGIVLLTEKKLKPRYREKIDIEYIKI